MIMRRFWWSVRARSVMLLVVFAVVTATLCTHRMWSRLKSCILSEKKCFTRVWSCRIISRSSQGSPRKNSCRVCSSERWERSKRSWCSDSKNSNKNSTFLLSSCSTERRRTTSSMRWLSWRQSQGFTRKWMWSSPSSGLISARNS